MTLSGAALRAQDENQVRAAAGQHRGVLLQGRLGARLQQAAGLSGMPGSKSLEKKLAFCGN